MPTDSTEYSSLPEVFTSGNEAKEVIHQPNDKEVAHWDQRRSHKFLANEDDRPYDVDSFPHGQSQSQARAKKSRKRTKWMWAALALIVALGVGLGAGLGLGLRGGSKHSATSQPSALPPGGTNPQRYLSTKGAFNGTGIACGTGNRLRLSTTAPYQNNDRDLLLFFQHYAGQIRWMQRLWPNTWQGGTAEEVIATDAKNGTSITMTSITLEYSEQYHVFYIDKNNVVKQRYRDNVTSFWYDGPLNDSPVRAYNSSRVALRSALYGGTIANVNLTGTRPWTGIRLFVGTSPSTIDQLVWRPGLPQWVWEQTWHDVSGYASPAYMGWAVGHTSYTMFVNTHNEVNMWWRDTDTGIANTEIHPVNQWTQSTINLDNVDPVMGLSYQGQLYGKNLTNGSVDGWNIFLQAENSTCSPSNALLPQPNGPKAISISSIDVEAVPIHDPEELLLFYQAKGDDILMLTGNIASGDWNSTEWPFPDN